MDYAIESGCKRLNLTATNTALTSVDLVGVFISAAASVPTIKIADSKGTILNTMTPTVGAYYKLPCRTVGTVTVTISGTVDATVFYV